MENVPWKSPRLQRMAVAVKIIRVAGALDASIGSQFRTRASEAAKYGFTPPELRGIWNVESFERDGQLVPPLATDNTRWQTLIFGDYRAVLMRRMDGKRGAFWFVQWAAFQPRIPWRALRWPRRSASPTTRRVGWQPKDAPDPGKSVTYYVTLPCMFQCAT